MEHLTDLVANFLKVLSDPTRLKIIVFLKDNPSTSTQIQKELGLSQSYASHQLKMLSNNGVTRSERVGKSKIFKINNENIFKLIALIKSYVIKNERFKLQKLSVLENFEEEQDLGELF